ncbi:MAG TPA: segregation/condensation protein A [Terracidiphilus sp.]|nr:segregation/condensation protein A [Terracidiphilus sp.]
MERHEAAPDSPVREPDPGPAPMTDPPPGLEPDPEPNPDPTPDATDPEPDRDPRPGPPEIREPERQGTGNREQATEMQGVGNGEKGVEGPEAPPLVLTHPKPAPAEKPAKAAPGKTKKPEAEEFSPFEVFVGHVYDGPLDLLLDLIRKQDIDIYDIPIARITAQFLAYVNQLKASDVDVAGEFIYTASLLIHIKSKMLLPREKAGPEDMGEDPRRELVERLLEHERFKNAAQMLQQKQMLEAATWTNPGVREFREDVNAEPEIAADTTDLVRIFRDIMERLRKRPIFNVQDDAVTVGQMIQFLSRRLTMEDRPIGLRKLLAHTKSERALVAMFLALLELVRLQAILLKQDRAFSEIFIKKSTEFDSVVTEGLAARDDWR